MIGAMEKGVAEAKLSAPPMGVYEGIDLTVLPKYLCFKAALLKEKLLLQNVILMLIASFGAYFFVSRYEVNNLYTKLREKEYILAPGVVDFTAASPQSVTDEYIENAITSFLNLFGNTNPSNIQRQYDELTKYMADDLKMTFEMQTTDWIDTVKDEGITDVLKITEKEIISDEKGNYKVVAILERDRYANNEYMGRLDEVIEMKLKLVPPQEGKRWFLQITSLSKSEANSFRSRSLTKDVLKETK